MFLTIDTSAVLSVLTNEPIKNVFIERTQAFELIAPGSLDAEIGNALSAMFKRGRIKLGQTRQILSGFETIPIRREALRLDRAIEISYTHNIYAYDAYVLDCAVEFNTPILSLDKQLLEIAGKLDIIILEV